MTTLTYQPSIFGRLIRFIASAAAGVFLATLLFWGMVKLIEISQTDLPEATLVDLGEFTTVRLPPPPPPVDNTIEKPPALMQAPPQMSAPSADIAGGIPTGFSSSMSDGMAFGNAFDLKSNIGKAGVGDSGLVLQTPLNPSYPSDASRRGVEGYVKLKVFVGANGRVERVEVVDGMPLGVFDQAAIEAARKARYKPKMVHGQPVAAVDKRKVNFRLDR